MHFSVIKKFCFPNSINYLFTIIDVLIYSQINVNSIFYIVDIFVIYILSMIGQFDEFYNKIHIKIYKQVGISIAYKRVLNAKFENLETL